MFDLQRIVIPKIMTKWEKLAEALHYDVQIIEAIKQKERGDRRSAVENSLKTGWKLAVVPRLVRKRGQHYLKHSKIQTWS